MAFFQVHIHTNIARMVIIITATAAAVESAFQTRSKCSGGLGLGHVSGDEVPTEGHQNR